MKLLSVLIAVFVLAGEGELSASPLDPQAIPVREVVSTTGSRRDGDERTIVVHGRERATVVRGEIRLADIADVNSRLPKDDEAVIALQKLVIAKSPKPGEEQTLSGQQILDALRSNNVDLRKIGYNLPRVVTVQRAARSLFEDEIRGAVESYLLSAGREAEVRAIRMPRDIKVSPQALEIEPIEKGGARSGGQTFQLNIRQEGQRVATFDIQAELEEWKELPVARRPIARGALIGAQDFVMARMSMAALPRDAAQEETGVIGLRTSQEIAPGEVFRRQHLVVPPMIEAGQRVTLMYRSRFLEATAAGVALAQGAQGDVIAVRNESSKKVVSGTISESGVVEVRP